MNTPPTEFTCIECGGVTHLLNRLPEDFYVEVGTSLAYRCSDCHDRFDVIWEETDDTK